MVKNLFLYATREGQTHAVCVAMAETMGNDSRILDITDPAAAQALMECERVVLGASIHYGHLPAALYAFIQNHCAALDARPNAFFCLNLTARKPGKDTPQGSVYVQKFLKKSPWKPQQLGVFAGALFYSRYTIYDRMMIRFIMWITGGPTDPKQDVEFTDWDKVSTTAREWSHQWDTSPLK